jgi:hypothetical protein
MLCDFGEPYLDNHNRIARILIRVHMVGVACRALVSSTPVPDSRHARFRSEGAMCIVVVDRRWSASPRVEKWMVESLIVGVGLA